MIFIRKYINIMEVSMKQHMVILNQHTSILGGMMMLKPIGRNVFNFDNKLQGNKDKIKKDKMKMVKGICWFLPEILMIKEYWNTIRPGAHLATPTRVSFRCYFPLIIISMQKIKHIYWFFPVILRIKGTLQSDWRRNITGYTQPKVVIAGATFTW